VAAAGAASVVRGPGPNKRVDCGERKREESIMNQEELIAQTKALLKRIDDKNLGSAGKYAEALEFLRVYGGGPKNSFFVSLKERPLQSIDSFVVRAVVTSFLNYLEAGLHTEVPPERRAQLDVVSDFLEMANALQETGEVHSATPVMLIGATLEEFLRTWVETEGLSLGTRKPGLETYSQVLRDADLITKQDGKDITAWAGLRNHAAHGEWDEVSDKKRVALMLEGVNLFIRKYSAS
jgi:hypothetical protein